MYCRSGLDLGSSLVAFFVNFSLIRLGNIINMKERGVAGCLNIVACCAILLGMCFFFDGSWVGGIVSSLIICLVLLPVYLCVGCWRGYVLGCFFLPKLLIVS